MNINNLKIGDNISFHASRITKGNPVKGKVVKIDNEWIEVELCHYIEGIVNVWYAGEIKPFRKSLINSIKML